MTSARLWPPLSLEESVLGRLEDQYAQRAAVDRSPRLNGDVAIRLVRNREAWPNIDPGVALAAAQDGRGPEDPVVQEAGRRGRRGIGLRSLGDVVSAVGRVAGTVASGVAEGLDTVLFGADEALAPVARGVVRTAATAAETPLQEVQAALKASIAGEGSLLTGDVDAWLEAYRKANTSTGRIALDQLLSGERVELGQGWLPGGAVGEQFGRESSALKFPGTDESVTLGRYVARQVTEPGTAPYDALSGLVDFGFSLGADPVALATGGASKVVATRKVLTASDDVLEGAGALNAARRAVRPVPVEQWLTSERGRNVVRAIAEEGDFDTLWQATKKKIDVRTTARLADARTEDEVLEILRPTLGVTVREQPTFGGFGYTVRKRMNGFRMLNSMPGSHLDLQDADAAVEGLDRFLRNARMDDAARADFTGRMARATTRARRMDVLIDSMTDTAGVLGEWGLKPDDARYMTQMFRDSIEDLRRYAVDEIGDNMHVPGAMVDGTGRALPTPHLLVEYIDRAVPLPDAREIRAATSLYAPILRNPAIKATASVLDSAQSAWKRAMLLRGAYTVRVVGEEQVRMAASGLDSMFAHPLSAIAWVTGRRGARDLTGEVFKEASEAAADLDEFGKALNRGWAGWADKRSRIATRHKILVARDSEDYGRAWADELMQLRADPVASAVAGATDDLGAVKASFWDGELSWARKELRELVGELDDRAIADAYIDSVWQRIAIKTQSEPDLIDMLATGKLDDMPMRVGESVNREFVDFLDSIKALGPEKVKGDLLVHANQTERIGDYYDKGTQAVFSFLMSRPTNYLSRSSTFKQRYWQRAEELLPFMDEAAQELAIRQAIDAGLSRSTVARMRKVSAKGDLNLEQADIVAKGFALDETKKLLYDLSERRQFFDAARLVFPFGDAWAELMTRWAKIGVERPQTLRRGQQVVTGARGSGFFYTDEQTGMEMFAYPGSELINEALIGVPIPFRGSVAGLSLMSTVLPGVSPVVQMPAGALLPYKPEFERVRELLFPFGERETEGGVLESLLPPWLQDLRQAMGGGADERLYDNTVADMQRFLMSTGEYDTATVDGMAELLEDSIKKAEKLYAVRAAGRFLLPSAPSPEAVVYGENGQLLPAFPLVQEFYELVEEMDGDTSEATQVFLERNGPDLLLLTQPKSMTVVGSVPVNTEGVRWAARNPDLVERFPNVYGYFAPQGGELDYAAYTRVFETGERESLTPEQQMRLANHRMASGIYQREKEALGARPNAAQAAWLRDLRQALIADYPGYQDLSGITQRVSNDTLIRELESAAENPKLARTEAGQALVSYLDARDDAIADAKARGLASFTSAGSARDLRDWLREYGDALTLENPTFAPMWDFVFSREMVEDEPVEEAA